jgi:hypothetical protein
MAETAAPVDVAGRGPAGGGHAPAGSHDITPYEERYAYPEAYPLELEVDFQPSYSRFLPFVKGILLLPHFLAALFVELMMLGVSLCAGVAVLVTGHYPESMFRLFVGGARWLVRIAAYLYLATDAYPPFGLYEVPNGAVRADFTYPPGGKIARWRPLFAWVLVIPNMFVLALRYIAMYVLLIGSFWSIVFTATQPRGVFDFVVRTLRMHCRVSGYAFFLTEKHPGF